MSCSTVFYKKLKLLVFYKKLKLLFAGPLGGLGVCYSTFVIVSF